MNLEYCQDRLDYRFADPGLLAQALRHRSYVAETTGCESNERLEFLGDAVLGIVVTDVLYRRYPDLAEGDLAKARSAVVNAEMLADVAGEIDLGEYVYLGKGEAASGGQEKPSILADALEAVIGAVYLDGGMASARRLVLGFLEDHLDSAAAGEGSKDYKTRLQEAATRRWGQLPVYEVRAFGPDHAKRFEATVYLDNSSAGLGTGRSKKQAEQAAARVAWEALAEPADEAGEVIAERAGDVTEQAGAGAAGGGHDG